MGTMIAGAGLLCAASVFAGDLRVAVVDLDRLIKAHPDTRTNVMILEQQVEDAENEQKKMVESLRELRSAIETASEQAQNEALSEKARTEAREEARSKFEELRRSEREARETLMMRKRELNDQRGRMQKRIVGKIHDVIKAHCEKENITLVLDAAGVGVQGTTQVIYSADPLDITDAIIKLMEAAGKASDDT
jgi:Skp family chaperone for outer membrane proteins